MLKLRTKTEKTVVSGRATKQVIIRFIIDKLEADANNIIALGYYYYFDENGQVVKLDNVRTIKEWAIVETVESNFLPPITNQNSLKEALLQRLSEFTNLQLTQENGENYGTIASDWEIDI